MTGLHPLAGDVGDPAPHRDRVAPWKVWCGLLLAPLAFSLQVVVSYVVTSNLCSANAFPMPYVLATCVSTMALAAGGVLAGWASWRHTRAESSGGAQELADRGDGRTRFMALFGLWGSSLFLLGIVVQAAMFFVLGPCAGFVGMD